MTTTNSVNELLARMGGKVLVIDPVTDDDETARNIEVLRFGVEVGDEITAGDGEDQDTGRVVSISGQFAYVAWQSGVKTNFPIAETITDPELIRALYDHPSAKSYGDGSYTVEL